MMSGTIGPWTSAIIRIRRNSDTRRCVACGLQHELSGGKVTGLIGRFVIVEMIVVGLRKNTGVRRHGVPYNGVFWLAEPRSITLRYPHPDWCIR